MEEEGEGVGLIELKGFPYWRNQLKDVPDAGSFPDVNASENCVPTELAAIVEYETGKIVAGDDIKSAVYGRRYQGGTSAGRFGDYLKAEYGLQMGYEPLPSASQQIIDRLRYWLGKGVPCVVTMHSQWSTPWYQVTKPGLHAGTAFAIDTSDSGMLHIANPWGGFDHVNTVAWWRARLGIGVYPVARLASQPAGLAGWYDDGTTLLAPNQVPVVSGFRSYVLAKAAAGAWPYDDYPLEAERAVGNVEASNPTHGAGSIQTFRRRRLVYTPKDGVYESWVGVELEYVETLAGGQGLIRKAA